MPRAICPQCHYPLSTCLCSAISLISSQTHIDILQHPSEVDAAKNTARLCTLCLPNCRIWVGETEEHFQALRAELDSETKPILLLYPGNDSLPIDQLAASGSGPVRLLLLDGTWKKAYKLKQLNSWLNVYPTVEINGVTGNYEVRKAPKNGQLSTLEAVYHSLRTLEPNLTLNSLLALFELRKDALRKR